MNSRIDARLILPDEITERFTALCETVGATHRALGRIVDEYVSEVPHGYHMAAYELFSDLYHQRTGEAVSARTIRAWRHAAIDFTKHELAQFESLSDAQLVESVKLAEIAKTEPATICEWAVANAVSTVPAMRANWLPQTTYEQEIDIPAISGLLRYADKHLLPERRSRFDELVNELRELMKPV